MILTMYIESLKISFFTDTAMAKSVKRHMTGDITEQIVLLSNFISLMLQDLSFLTPCRMFL